MSAWPRVDLYCDVSDCEFSLSGHLFSQESTARTISEAREEHRRFGWAHRRGYDLCPAHAEAMKGRRDWVEEIVAGGDT